MRRIPAAATALALLAALVACDRGNYTSAEEYAAAHPTTTAAATTPPTTPPPAPTATPTPTTPPAITTPPPTTTPPPVAEPERATFFCDTADDYIAEWFTNPSPTNFQTLRAWINPTVIARIPDGGDNDDVKSYAASLAGDLDEIWTKVLHGDDASTQSKRAAADTLLLVSACETAGSAMDKTHAALAAEPDTD